MWKCYRCRIFTPLSICRFICMTVMFISIRPDFQFFFIFSFLFISTILTRLWRLFDCKSANGTYIAVTFIPITITVFCIVCFIKINIMMFAGCSFIHNASTWFHRSTLCTTIFCISITSTSRLYSYTFISVICARSGHINRIYKNCTPHKLIVVIGFFAVTHGFWLAIIHIKALGISAIIWIVVALFIGISIMVCIIYSALSWNKSKVCSNRYIHLYIRSILSILVFLYLFFDCHCCNRTIFECKVSFAFAANRKCHSTKRNCLITFSGYFIVYFYSFNLTWIKIIT